VLSSKKEAVVYCSSATAKEGVKFESRLLKLKDLSLSDGSYRMDIVKPDKGVLTTHHVTVENGAVSIRLPAFTDDIAVHIYRSSDRTTGFKIIPVRNRHVLDLSTDDIVQVMSRAGFSDDQIMELGTDVHNGMLRSGAVQIKVEDKVQAVFAAKGDNVFISSTLTGHFLYNVKTGWRRPGNLSP